MQNPKKNDSVRLYGRIVEADLEANSFTVELLHPFSLETLRLELPGWAISPQLASGVPAAR